MDGRSPWRRLAWRSWWTEMDSAGKLDGAVAMPYSPRVGTVWELRDVLPRSGEPYRATVKRVWKEGDSLRVEFEREDRRGTRVLEIWIERRRARAPG